jgi:hypothetical protein
VRKFQRNFLREKIVRKFLRNFLMNFLGKKIVRKFLRNFLMNLLRKFPRKICAEKTEKIVPIFSSFLVKN